MDRSRIHYYSFTLLCPKDQNKVTFTIGIEVQENGNFGLSGHEENIAAELGWECSGSTNSCLPQMNKCLTEETKKKVEIIKKYHRTHDYREKCTLFSHL